MPHDDTVSPNNESVVTRSDLAHGTRFVDDERVIVIPDDPIIAKNGPMVPID